MPFTPNQFMKTRPWLFHLTATGNVDRILSDNQIHPASTLLNAAGRQDLLSVRRRDSEEIAIHGRRVHVRDQKPLHAGSTLLQGGWTFERLVEELNHRVFFWPGNENKPIPQGLNHFTRYKSESCRVLVIPTHALLAANPDGTPEFCRYNSGSPRCNPARHRNGSPRGPATFVSADRFEGTSGTVVEVTFRHGVSLPTSGVVVRPVTDFV